MGTLLMPLVEGGKVGISNGGAKIRLVIESEIKGIVVNSLILVLVVELEIVGNVVGGLGGICGFVEGKSVQVFN